MMAVERKIQTLLPGVLTVSVFTGFEPFAFYRGKELVGFDVDILRSFARQHRLEARFLPVDDFDKVWLRPGRNESDLATAGIARFDERLSATVSWSTPYHAVMRSILVHQDDTAALRTIADFAGRSIAFVAGSSADLDTRARASDSVRLVPIDNQAQGVSLLRSRTVDGLAMGAPSNAFNRIAHPEFSLIDVHEFSQPEDLRFALNAANGNLLEALNGFIAQATDNGEIAVCFKRWMSDSL